MPIALNGVYDLLPIHTRHFYPGPLTFTAGEPIPTAGMTVRQTEELTERLRLAIDELRQPGCTSRAETNDADPVSAEV